MTTATAMSEATDTIDIGSDLRPPEPRAKQPDRVVTATRARAMIDRGDKDLQHRLEQYRMVADAYDRIPPDTDAQLRADGLGWAANVDWGGMEASVDEAVSPLVNLMMQPDTFVRFHSRARVPGLSAGLEALARADTEMLRDWPELPYQSQLMLHHRVSFGLGIFHWPTPHGWHFQALHPANLIVPERAPLNPEKWSWAAIKTEFEIADLVAKLADPEAARAQGWKLGAIRRALEKYRHGEGNRWPADRDVEAIVHGFCQGNSWGVFDDSVTIKGYILYVREFDGTVSEHWLTNQDGTDFLFQREKRHRRMSHMIALFPHGLGDGFLTRLRGLGVKLLPYHDMENRTLNHTIDVTWLSSNLMLKGGQDHMNRLPEMVIGPVTLVPDDFDIAQVSFSNPAAGLLQLSRELQIRKAGRNKVFGGEVDTSPRVDSTASGARMRYQEQGTLRDHDIARFYLQLTQFHWTRWLRVSDPDSGPSDPGYQEAQIMLETALQSGVHPDIIAGVYKAQARTIFGDGDPVNQFLAMMDVMPFLGQMSAQGRRTFAKRALTARLRDADLAEELLGDPGLDDLDTRQRQIAQGENADFQTSDVRIAVAGTDHHIIHAGEHAVFAEDTMAQLNEGLISEEQGYQTLARAREHVLGHLQMIASDELSQDIYKDQVRRWSNVENRLRQLGQHLEAKRAAERERQLEELRNPAPSVKDLAAAETERLKQEAILRETETKIAVAERESQARIETLRRESTAKGEIMKLKDLDTVEA